MTEKTFQAQIIQIARLNRWMVYHTHDSRRSAPGFPDLVMVRGSELLMIELKTERGKTTPDQDAWQSALQGVQDIRAGVWRPSDWEKITAALSRRKKSPSSRHCEHSTG